MVNKLQSLFGQYLQLGESGKIESFESCLSNLGIDFGCFRYSCIRDKMHKNPKLAVGFEEEIKDIASKIGIAMGKKKVYHIPMVGHTYSGKTMLSRVVEFLSNENGLKATYHNCRDILDEEEEVTEYEKIIGSIGDFDVIILDDAWLLKDEVGVIKNVMKEMEKGAVVTVWKYLNYVGMENEIYREIGDTLGEVVVRDMSVDMANGVFSSMWSIIGHGEPGNLKKFFRRIFREVGGSPGVSIKLFVDITRSYCQERPDMNVGEYVDRYLKKLLEPLQYAKELDTVKLSILNAILTEKDRRGAMPSVISSNIGKDNATVTYHLNKLKEMKLVRDIRFGKNIFYSVIDVYAPFLEKIAMDRMREVLRSGDSILQSV